MHKSRIDTLPDGAFITLDGESCAVRGDALIRWTPEGYTTRKSRPHEITVDVLTPPSILMVLSAGYRLDWHPSADN
jgi:hypothetical protein